MYYDRRSKLNIIKVGNTAIEYDIIRTNRKTIGIIVDPEQGVVVRSPKYVTEDKVNELIKNKSDWILEKIEKVQEIKPAPRPKEFLSGEKLPYLGRRYRIKLIRDDKKGVEVKLIRAKFMIRAHSKFSEEERREMVKEKLIQWYRSKSDIKIRERVDIYKEKLVVEPENITVKKQEKRWGSCSSLGNLNFNWKLIMAPVSVLDYVVVHELIHLIHPNHSRDFWSLVETIIPDYKEKREWLRINGKSLDF